jgi:tetratricopeptide (TPR) repeat protein
VFVARTGRAQRAAVMVREARVAPQEKPMKVRCQRLFPGRILLAHLVERESLLGLGVTEWVLEFQAGAPVQVEPPSASGCEVVEATPEEWAALRAAGFDLPQAAAEIVADAAQDDPYNQGCELLAAGQLPEAIEAFTQAIEADARDAQAYYNRGYAHSLALKRLTWAQIRFPDGRIIAAGYDPRLASLIDQAVDDYTRALECDPRLTKALGMRAEMYFLKGLRDPAIADLQLAAAHGDKAALGILKERFGDASS